MQYLLLSIQYLVGKVHMKIQGCRKQAPVKLNNNYRINLKSGNGKYLARCDGSVINGSHKDSAFVHTPTLNDGLSQ